MSEAHLSELPGCYRWGKFSLMFLERDIFSPEHVQKGRRHRSLFPRDQIQLAPKGYLQWHTATSEHPQGATLVGASAWLPGPLWDPLGCGEVCCEAALRGCTKGSLTGRADTEKLEKIKAEECNSLGLRHQDFAALNRHYVLSISAGDIRPVLTISKRNNMFSFV